MGAFAMVDLPVFFLRLRPFRRPHGRFLSSSRLKRSSTPYVPRMVGAASLLHVLVTSTSSLGRTRRGFVPRPWFPFRPRSSEKKLPGSSWDLEFTFELTKARRWRRRCARLRARMAWIASAVRRVSGRLSEEENEEGRCGKEARSEADGSRRKRRKKADCGGRTWTKEVSWKTNGRTCHKTWPSWNAKNLPMET